MVSFVLLYAVEAANDLVLEAGVGVVERQVLDLAVQTRAWLGEFGDAMNRDAAPIVAVKVALDFKPDANISAAQGSFPGATAFLKQ